MYLNSKDMKNRAEEYRVWAEKTRPGILRDVFVKRAVELDDLALVLEKIEELRNNTLEKFGLRLT